MRWPGALRRGLVKGAGRGFAIFGSLGLAACLGVCPPLYCKNMCCASRLCRGGKGAGGSRSKNLLEGAMKHNLRLLDAAGSRGRGACGTRKLGQSAQAESTQGVFVRKRGGVQKSMGNKVPWKIRIRDADLSLCNFATTHFLTDRF